MPLLSQLEVGVVPRKLSKGSQYLKKHLGDPQMKLLAIPSGLLPAVLPTLLRLSRRFPDTTMIQAVLNDAFLIPGLELASTSLLLP